MKKFLAFVSILTISVGSVFAQTKIEKETLVYSTKDDQELYLDKYVDNMADFQGKRPVMIYIHGGGFSMGSRTNALQIKYDKHFAKQGFVSISIDYRLGIKPGVQADQTTVLHAISIAMEDLFDATAFIINKEKDWNIDVNKIMISGGSAGAITCLNAEYELCTGGPLTKKLPEGFRYAGVISQAGCVVVHEDTLNWKTSPCPILLMHGSKDQAVPFDSYSLEGNIYAGSNYIHKQLVKLNSPHWLYEETGADHIMALKPLQYNFGEIDSFIDKFVIKGQHAIVNTVWTDNKPDSMADMQKIVPLYIIGWDKTDEEVEAGKK